MALVLQRARQDVAQRILWKARHRLEGYVGSRGYHHEVVEMLGDVCFQMGDMPAAGRFWFFCPTDSDAKRAAVELFVRRCQGDPPRIWSQLPRRLRHTHERNLPPEVGRRLRTLAEQVRRAPGKRRPRHRAASPRSKAADRLALTMVLLVAIFFLYCFGLGLAQLLARMNPHIG